MNDSPTSTVGTRIRQARETLGWNQTQLASAIGLGSAQIVSTIENGQRELKAWEVVRIANALQVSIEALLRGDSSPAVSAQWRGRASALGGEVEARFLRRARQYMRLEEWCDATHHKALSSLDIWPNCSYESVQAEADKMRRYMELGGRPALTLCKALEEDYGVKIFHEDLGNIGAGLAASGEFGMAILLNAQDTPWRRNFSLAHELFHLITPSDFVACGRTEQLAEVFASQLVLPAEPVHELIRLRVKDGKLSFVDLVEAAREFAVSSEALLWRLVNLGKLSRDSVKKVLDDPNFRVLDRASFPEWGKPSILPERYQRLAFTAFSKGKIGLARLAEFLESSLVDLTDQIAAVQVEAVSSEGAQVTVG